MHILSEEAKDRSEHNEYGSYVRRSRYWSDSGALGDAAGATATFGGYSQLVRSLSCVGGAEGRPRVLRERGEQHLERLQ